MLSLLLCGNLSQFKEIVRMSQLPIHANIVNLTRHVIAEHVNTAIVQSSECLLLTDLISWLYLASLSDLQGAPVLIYNTVECKTIQ